MNVVHVDGNREVVPRELGYVLQDSLDIQPAWYVDDDGALNMAKLLTAFRTFFREHADHWLDHLGDYREAGPQLILQAYLQRVVNGGGRIEREYGLARQNGSAGALAARAGATLGFVAAHRLGMQGAARFGSEEP